ncbi:serine hydrolase domain-containing protein [Dasania marina]|uniref:serine hydrolase domain-containing protein n=1 Tax=Dasania marina TaxID=471499 RepID=UPI00035DF195|nr:serine hydrolase [Dasania marina]
MKKTLKYSAITLFVLLVLISGLAALNWDKVMRLQRSTTLFDENTIIYNFSHMNEIFPVVPLKREGAVFEFGQDPHPLPENFYYNEQKTATTEFLERRATTALLVIKNDNIHFEKYYLGTHQNDLRISWSVGKSFVSALMGIAIGEGLIDSEKAVSDYVPELKNSGYNGVKIRDVLQMSSGIAWNEDYSDFSSDINRMSRALALDGSLDELASTLVNESTPGTKWRYVSMDTHVLSMVVRAATGERLSKYFQKRIWSKIGAEADGYWLTDSHETEFALGGINMRSRDFARFGRLYLNNGNWQGEQIVPQQWVELSTVPSAPHVTGDKDSMGYGYQWWLGQDARPGEFVAIGVYGQYIYINQPENLIIVKSSADRLFMTGINSMQESIAFFRSVADSLH